MLDLESLRCFVAASEQGSFRVAARGVGLSAAAFGARIKSLEQQLNVQLFERTTRRLRMTVAGERLLPEARASLLQARRCVEAVREEGPLPFSLTLGTRYELGLSFLVPALDTLGERDPARSLHLYFGDTPDLLPRLTLGQLDCMLTSARIAERGLEFARVHEERYVFVGRRDLLATQRIRGPADSAHHVLLDSAPDLPLFRYFLDARPSHEQWRFRDTRHLGTIAAVRARVLAGAGIAVLPEYFVRADLACRRLAPILPRTRLPSDWFRLVWRKGHAHDGALAALATELSALPLR